MESERSPLMQTLLLAVVILGVGSGAWYVLNRTTPELPYPAPEPPTVEDPVATEPEIAPRYPIEAIRPPPIAVQSQLPESFESDAYVRDALIALFAQPQLAQWLVPEHLVQRFVAFIDALPSRTVSTQLWPVKPVAGRFFVEQNTAGTVISPVNDTRYDPYVAMLVGVDRDAAVALYLRLYPLLEQAYRELGHPSRTFNDRMVTVLDHLLAAPEPVAPVVVRMDERGRWIYADAELESASAGQKFLIRLGARNEARVKAKLREFRAALAGAR